MKLGNILAQLRNQKGLNQRELAQALGVSNGAIAMWETNKRQPDLDMVAKLAEYFQVSTDYLLCKSDDKKTEQKKEDEHTYFFFFFDDLLRDIFSSRCNELLEEKHLSVNSLSEATGININRCQKYIQAECEPSLEDLISISQVLETTTDYLLGQTPKITYYENKILSTFVKLNPDNKDILIGKAKELLREQRQEAPIAADVPLKMAK